MDGGEETARRQVEIPLDEEDARRVVLEAWDKVIAALPRESHARIREACSIVLKARGIETTKGHASILLEMTDPLSGFDGAVSASNPLGLDNRGTTAKFRLYMETTRTTNRS